MPFINNTPPPSPPPQIPTRLPAQTPQLAAHRAAVESCIARWENEQRLGADGIAALRSLLASASAPPAARFDRAEIDPCEQWGLHWMQVTAAVDGDALYLGPDAHEQLLLPCASDAMTLAPDVVVLKVGQPEDDGVFDVTRMRALVWWRDRAWTLALTDHGDGACIVQLSARPG